MNKEYATEEAIRAVKTDLDHRCRAIFTKSDLQEIAIQNLPDVGVNQRTLIKGQILKYLWEKEKLKEVVFEFPSRKETRYLFGNITNFELAQSLKPHAYLAHRLRCSYTICALIIQKLFTLMSNSLSSTNEILIV